MEKKGGMARSEDLFTLIQTALSLWNQTAVRARAERSTVKEENGGEKECLLVLRGLWAFYSASFLPSLVRYSFKFSKSTEIPPLREKKKISFFDDCLFCWFCWCTLASGQRLGPSEEKRPNT